MNTIIYIKQNTNFHRSKMYCIRCLSLSIVLLLIVTIKNYSQSDTISFESPEREIPETGGDEKAPPFYKAGCGSNESIDPIDTTYIRFRKKAYEFIGNDEQMVIDRIDLQTGERERLFDVEDCESPSDKNKFRGHWSGIEFGINDFVNNDLSLDRPDGYGYLDLNTPRSWNFNFNFAQSSTPLIGNKFGYVGGLGLEISNYHFQDHNNIQKSPETGDIIVRDLEEDYYVRRSKFTSTYLTAPALLELQFGEGSSKDRFYISAGAVGGLRLGSSVKVVHEVDGKKQKIKERGVDLNMHRWRIGLTARTGYKDFFDFYATYYLTPLFEKGKAPELHPFAAGLRISF